MRCVDQQQRRCTLASQVSRMEEEDHHEYDIVSVSSPRVAAVMTPASTTTVCWDTRWDVYTQFEQRSGKKCKSCVMPGQSAEYLAGNTQNRPAMRYNSRLAFVPSSSARQWPIDCNGIRLNLILQRCWVLGR